MELTNFAPRANKWSSYLLIGSVILNVALVLVLCFSSFGAQEAVLAAPVARAARPVMPQMAQRAMSRKEVMRGAMGGIAAALAGGIKNANAADLKDKSVKKICSSNPTASVCVKPGGYEAAKKR